MQFDKYRITEFNYNSICYTNMYYIKWKLLSIIIDFWNIYIHSICAILIPKKKIMKIDWIYSYFLRVHFFLLTKFSMNILFCSVLDTRDKLFCFNKEWKKKIIKLLLNSKFYSKCSIFEKNSKNLDVYC